MKFGVFYQLQALRPVDKEQWDPDAELRTFQEALEQIEFADSLGFEYVFETEHHFLEEYSHSSAPEVFLAAASQRTKKMRLGHGIVQMPPRQNHPARVAERIATLDLVSNGRVEFGTGEGATTTEVGGFGTVRAEKKEAWEEATRETVRMLTMTPYPGFEGQLFSMPERNIIPKPLQKPHPPLWVAAGRRDSVMLGARLGMGALGFGFETPEEADERVTRYYELIRGCRQPIGVAMNPALATVANMMMAPTDEEAVARGLRGAQYFGFALGYTNGPVDYGRHNIHRTFAERFEGVHGAPPTVAEPEDETQRTLFRAGQRGRFIGGPDYVRENLRLYEEAHLDLLLFFLQCGDRKHEHIMESLELFAQQVMPEFQERHEQHQKWREQQLDGVKHPINSSI